MRWLARRVGRRPPERELDAELLDHIERYVADAVRRGVPEQAARREARTLFGGVEQVKEACRDVHRTRWIADLGQDIRFGLRLLLKERWFSLTAGTALAFGIGATTAIFTIQNGYYFRGLPVEDPDRVLALGLRDRAGQNLNVSQADLAISRDTLRGFDAIGAYRRAGWTIAEPNIAAESVGGVFVSADVFAIVEARAAIGRVLDARDERPGAPAVVVLSDGLWQRRYDGDPDIVGRTVLLDRAPAVVVGIMPAGFGFPYLEEAWRPLASTEVSGAGPDGERVGVVAGVAPGVSPSQAATELSALVQRLERERGFDAARGSGNGCQIRHQPDRPALRQAGG